jgi:Domain of unknown function (DUF6532)
VTSLPLHLYSLSIFLLQTKEIVDTEPFGHPIIADIIRAQWFGKGKADVRAYNKMVALSETPETIIILVVTAVWFCLILGPNV